MIILAATGSPPCSVLNSIAILEVSCVFRIFNRIVVSFFTQFSFVLFVVVSNFDFIRVFDDRMA